MAGGLWSPFAPQLGISECWHGMDPFPTFTSQCYWDAHPGPKWKQRKNASCSKTRLGSWGSCVEGLSHSKTCFFDIQYFFAVDIGVLHVQSSYSWFQTPGVRVVAPLILECQRLFAQRSWTLINTNGMCVLYLHGSCNVSNYFLHVMYILCISYGSCVSPSDLRLYYVWQNPQWDVCIMASQPTPPNVSPPRNKALLRAY